VWKNTSTNYWIHQITALLTLLWFATPWHWYLCIFTQTDCIISCKQRHSSVLDVSNTFETTNHSLLLTKLIKCCLPSAYQDCCWVGTETRTWKWSGARASQTLSLQPMGRDKGGFWDHIDTLYIFTVICFQTSCTRPDQYEPWLILLWITYCFLMTFVCLVPASVVFNAF